MKKLLSLFCVLAISTMAARSVENSKLNLLFITADDMNADSPGWMGSDMGATPVLDGFAATCHRFVNDHVTVPICQPSREAFMTGRVPHHSGGLGFNPITPGTPTMVTVLQAAGYYTAAVNKISHMQPPSAFPWDDKFDGSGKNPAFMRTQFEKTLKSAAASGKPFFINVNIQYEISDPTERNNSIGDAHYAAEIQRLAGLLLAHMEKTSDPQTANFKKAYEDWKAKTK